MAEEPDSAQAASRHWTRIDDYLTAMRWRGAAYRRRRRTRVGHRAEPERLMLGMVPFMALIIGLAVIAVAIFISAWPGGRGERRADPPEERRLGTAPPGWIDG